MDTSGFAAAVHATGIPVPAGLVPAGVFLRYAHDVAKALGLRIPRGRSPAAFALERTKFFEYTTADRFKVTPELVWTVLTKEQHMAFITRQRTGTKRAREPAAPTPTTGDLALTEMRAVVRRFLTTRHPPTVALVNQQFASETGVGWHLLCRELVRHFHPILPVAESLVALRVAADTGVNTRLAYFSALRALAAEMAAIVTFLMDDVETAGAPEYLRCELVRDKRDFPAHSPAFLCRLHYPFSVDIPEALLAEHPRLRDALAAVNTQLARGGSGRFDRAFAVLFFIILSEVDPLAVLVLMTAFKGRRPFISLLGIETNGEERGRTVSEHHRFEDLEHWRELDDVFLSAMDTPAPR